MTKALSGVVADNKSITFGAPRRESKSIKILPLNEKSSYRCDVRRQTTVWHPRQFSSVLGRTSTVLLNLTRGIPRAATDLIEEINIDIMLRVWFYSTTPKDLAVFSTHYVLLGTETFPEPYPMVSSSLHDSALNLHAGFVENFLSELEHQSIVLTALHLLVGR